MTCKVMLILTQVLVVVVVRLQENLYPVEWSDRRFGAHPCDACGHATNNRKQSESGTHYALLLLLYECLLLILFAKRKGKRKMKKNK